MDANSSLAVAWLKSTVPRRMLSGSPSWRDDVDGNGAASGGDELCGQVPSHCENCPRYWQVHQGSNITEHSFPGLNKA